MARDVWREILEAAKAGEAPLVELSPGAHLKRAKHPRRGRPPIFGATRYQHYANYDPARSGRPRCRWSKCSRPTRRDAACGCCPEHTQYAIEEARMTLKLAEDFLSAGGKQIHAGYAQGSTSGPDPDPGARLVDRKDKS